MKKQSEDRAAVVRAAYARLGDALAEVLALPETPKIVRDNLTEASTEIANRIGCYDSMEGDALRRWEIAHAGELLAERIEGG